MQEKAIDHKRIAKNTFYLYARKIITIFIGLYSSRLLLERLGVNDFGLYGLIGSIVLVFNSLRSLFSTSIYRFINIARGKEDVSRINKIFSYGLLMNAAIAVVFALCVEIGGVIMIPKLNISPEDIPVAFFILHFSVLSAILSIMTSPYDAMMIAHERFKAQAGFSVLDSILRFAAILLLAISPIRQVEFYAVLLLIVAIIIRVLSSLYCHRVFPLETKFHYTKDVTLLREMLSYSGWNSFGNISYSLVNEGLNFILNIFGGVVVNAARTIAFQVRSFVSQFSSELLDSFRPQTIAAYGREDFKAFNTLIFSSARISFIISSIPVIVLASFSTLILELWLGNVPEYTNGFVRGVLLYVVVRSFHSPIDTIFKASGRIKTYQLMQISISILNLLFGWVVLKIGFPYYSVFLVMVGVEIINLAAILVLAMKQEAFPLRRFISTVLLRCLISMVLMIALYIVVSSYCLNNNIWIIGIEAIILCAVSILINFFIVLTDKEKKLLLGFIKK